MDSGSTNAKEKIFQAALELITGGESAESITTRQIAQKAGVNLALINYYYQSKENLMRQVAESRMGEIISQVLAYDDEDLDTEAKLKRLLAATADFSFQHNEIFKIAVAGELKDGCKNSCGLVMPLLKEIFREKSELELRIIALQLLLPFHFIVLYPERYKEYLNTDFFDEQQRTRIINQMTDSILAKAQEGSSERK